MPSSGRPLGQKSKTFKTPSRSLIAWVLPRLLPLSLIAIGTSCSLQKEVLVYSRATRAKEETNGHLRLAQNSVKVNVTGTKAVSEFSPCGGYYLIHEDDLVAFVRAARRLAMSEAAGRVLTEKEIEESLRK